VRFAEALLAHQNQAAAAGPATTGGGHERRRRLPQWAMVAAAMLVVAVGGYALVELTRVQAPPQPAENPRAAAPTLPVPVPTAPAPPQPETRSPDTPVLSFMLLPPTRGINEPPTLAVRSESAKVEVRVVLESDDFRRYQVVLKDPGTDRIIWRSARLMATLSGRDRIVPVTLDTSSLKPQRYVLDLTGFPATGEAQLIASYPFRLAFQ
jgi:hypothetical protein